MTPTIWTIGHSTRLTEEFLGLLRVHDIRRLFDVRTVPRSRYNPQFNGDTLAQSLMEAGIDYRQAKALGGLRKPKKDSINQGWRNASFRGYADYMQTEDFRKALADLIRHASEQPTAIMCAEAVPWRCHRSLIADALLCHGIPVRHITTASRADPHQMTSFAERAGDRVIYPAQRPAPRLF